MFMWTIDRVIDELNKLCAADNLPNVRVPVRTNSRLKTTLGRVRFMRDTCLPVFIEFSQNLLNEGTDNDVMNVIKHEYAHYFLLYTTGENHGHDALFKQKCAEIGCEHDKTHNGLESDGFLKRDFKYEVWCEDCGEMIRGYSRMCKTLKELNYCVCGICNQPHLKMIQNW